MNSIGSPFASSVFQGLDDDGVPLAGGKLYSYVSGTSTPLTTYNDSDLDPGHANTNPVILNAAGIATVFLKPTNGNVGQTYDFVLKDASDVTVRSYLEVSAVAPSDAPNLTNAVLGYGSASTLTIAGGSISPTANVHLVSPEGGSADNLDTIVTTGLPDGAPLTISNTNGAAAITVRSGVGNILLPGGTSIVLSSTTTKLTLTRFGSSFILIANSAAAVSTAAANTDAADGRLTLTTGVPVTTSDVTAATTIYYTPYKGNAIDLWNGSAWERMTFSELSVSVPAAANGVYDIFAQKSGSTVIIAAASQWATLTTRNIALSRLNGVLVLSSNNTLRYLGTVATTGVSGQTEDSLTKRYLWNYYNRVRRPVLVTDSTATWSYITATWRQANANTANQIGYVCGVSEDTIDLTVRATVSPETPQQMFVGIGVDSTTAPQAGFIGCGGSFSGSSTFPIEQPWAYLSLTAPIGRRNYTWLERGLGSSGSGGACTWFSFVSDYIQSGLSGSVMA